MNYYVNIMEYATKKAVKSMGPYASEKTADKIDDGVNRNLDHERFYTLVENKPRVVLL